MSYTSLEELVFPDALGNKILINPFEAVEDTTDNRGSQVMAASTDFLAALMRGHWSVEIIPVAQESLNWDYATKTLTISGGDLTVELMWLDINTRLASATRIILQQGAHQLLTYTDIFVRPSVGADVTIGPSATDIVTDNAFVEGGTSIADIQTTLDDIGSTDFFNQPDYLGAEAVIAMLPLMKVSGRSLSLFGGKVRIRDAYDFKLLDRDTQYVQVLDDAISSTATVGAWELTGQDNSLIAFGDSSSITMGDNSSWISGDNPLVSFGTGTTDIDIGGTLDMEVTSALNNVMKFGGEIEFGVWDGAAFDASLQFGLVDTYLEESRGGDIVIQNTNISTGGITLSTVQGDLDNIVLIGDFLVDVFSGNIVLDTNAGDIVLVTGTAGDLDVDVDELFMDLTGAGASYIQKTAGSLQFRTTSAGVPLDVYTTADTSDLDLYTDGIASFLNLYTSGVNSDLTVETQAANARARLRTLAGWTSPTHPGSYVDIQSPGGVVIGRTSSGDIETLPDPVTALFSDLDTFPLGDGDVEGTTVAFLNTRARDSFGDRQNILRWLAYNSGDAAGVPHYQAEVRVSAADTGVSSLSSWSLRLNDNAGVTSLVELLHVGGFTGAEDKVSILNAPLLVDADGTLTSIPDPSFAFGAPTSKAAIRANDALGAILSLINTDQTDAVEERIAGLAFGGYRNSGTYVDQAGIVAMSQGANDDALMRFFISDNGGNMAKWLDVTNPGGAQILADLFGDLNIGAAGTLTTTNAIDMLGGATFDADIDHDGSGAKVLAPNQIWAAAEFNLNLAVTQTTSGTHAPSTTGLLNGMRVDSVIRITGTNTYQFRMDSLSPSAQAIIVPVVRRNQTSGPYTHVDCEVTTWSNTLVNFRIIDTNGTIVAAGGDMNEGDLNGDLTVAIYVLTGE